MTKRYEYSSRGYIRFWYEWKYDEDGNIVEYTAYNNSNNGSVNNWRGYEYDEFGNMTKEIMPAKDGFQAWTSYEYIMITPSSITSSNMDNLLATGLPF